MSIQSDIRTGFAAIKTAMPESVVSVGFGGATADGIKSNWRRVADLGDMGERGLATGTVRVDASELGTPERGDRVTIDGEGAIVTDTALDAAGALLTLVYQQERPVTFADDIL